MSAKYEELIEAGAPRLPEGYYYKVAAGLNDTGAYVFYVRILRERSWWFDKRMAFSTSYASEVTSVEHVANLCRWAWGKTPREKLHDNVKPFLGRHP